MFAMLFALVPDMLKWYRQVRPQAQAIGISTLTDEELQLLISAKVEFDANIAKADAWLRTHPEVTLAATASPGIPAPSTPSTPSTGKK